MGVVETLMFGSAVSHAKHEDFLVVLRQVAQDPDSGLRARALALLAAEGDEPTRRRLLESLGHPDQAPLPPARIVQLLGLVLTDSVYPVLNALLLRSPDEATRLETIRLLGAYPPSRPLLVRYLQDGREPDAVRLTAMAALHAGVPQEFPRLALPVILDEGASDTLRTYGILATSLRRRALRVDSVTVAGAVDSFDKAIHQLATESRSPAVRAAAAQYLQARGLQREP
jgi:hypothetical protein